LAKVLSNFEITFKTFFLVFLGGGLGSLLRLLVSLLLRDFSVFSQDFFPLSTLFVNLLGSFLIGVCFCLKTNLSFDFSFNQKEIFAFLTTGFLGGFTTFSLFSQELALLLLKSQYFLAFVYLFLTFFLGIFLFLVGYYGTKYFFNLV